MIFIHYIKLLKNKYVLLAIRKQNYTMKQYKNLFILLILLQITWSCTESKNEKKFKEGIIEYSIQFGGTDPSKINSNLLPNKLTVKFRNNNTSNRIEGLSGNVNLTFIQNINDNDCIVLVNIWNKKLYYQDSLSNLPNAYIGMPELLIEKTNEVVNYKGYNCKKAIVHYKDTSNFSFEVLYTNDINISNPNANTPFDLIDGVMLKFSVKLHKYIMNISATSIKSEDISMDEFTAPSDYEKVPKRTIEDLISLIQ
jgi:GLPGLI family protein